MKFLESYIKGLYLVENDDIRVNERDTMIEIYSKKIFSEYGIEAVFDYEFQFKLKRGALRGLYFYPGKNSEMLLKSVNGEIYCVALDIRDESPTYGKYYGAILSSDNNKLLYIPDQFAYGFLALTDNSILNIKTSNNNLEVGKTGIVWNDMELKIEWLLSRAGNITITKADHKWLPFRQVMNLIKSKMTKV